MYPKKLMKRIAGVALVLILLLAPVTIAGASDLTDLRSGVSPDKSWTVYFSSALKSDTINDVNFNVTDSLGKDVEVSLSHSIDYKSVQIKPKSNYQYAQTYHLNIDTGVTSAGGAKLKAPIDMPFRIMSRGSKIGSYSISPITDFSSRFTLNLSNPDQAHYYNVFRTGDAINDNPVAIDASLVTMPQILSSSSKLLVRFYADAAGSNLVGTAWLDNGSLYLLQ